MRHVLLLADALGDLQAARDFYNARENGAGEYCMESLLADCEKLHKIAWHPSNAIWMSSDARESISIRHLLSRQRP